MNITNISSKDIKNYVKTIKNHMAENDKHDDYYAGYSDALQLSIDSANELVVSEKVTIPQYIATLIEENKTYGLRTPLSTAYYIAESLSSGDKYYHWLKDKRNQKLLLHAIADGYEVEDE